MARQIILTTVFLLAIAASAKAQVFNVKAFDGTAQKITVLADEEKEKLRIISLKDTIVVNARFIDFVGKVRILDGHFLRINYSMMAGSGLHMERTIIVCVNNRHLIEALHLTSLFREEFIDYSKPLNLKNMVGERSVYELNLELTGTTPQTYRMNITLHDAEKLRDAPKRNYDHREKVVLTFDPQKNIFCNKQETLSRYFNFSDPGTGKKTKRHVNGTFPTIVLGKTRVFRNTKCYYINGAWYEDSGYGDLTELAYR